MVTGSMSLAAPPPGLCSEDGSGQPERFTDEYDAAQERGDHKNGERSFSKAQKVGVSDRELSGKNIYEARLVRDAEEVDPGIVHRTLDGRGLRAAAPPCAVKT